MSMVMGKSGQKIVVIGGGTAGWMTAAAIATAIPAAQASVTLIESEAIGIVGVGEATLPHLRRFNENLGIDEATFMAATSATFKLGIEFRDWGAPGEAYIHPFGAYGAEVGGVAFHHFWRKLAHDDAIGNIAEYSLPIVAAYRGKFRHPADQQGAINDTYGYAYQMDATRYAPFLRELAESRGVERHEGIVTEVIRHPQSGDIDGVRLDGHDAMIEGDFFIDCSGFKGLLIEESLGAGYEDWRRWLPCDSAVAAPSVSTSAQQPYTVATAHKAGWRWQIPLQHRDGNGLVFCSEHLDETEARAMLEDAVDSEFIAEPRLLRFMTGMRSKQWHHNCVAIGLAGGFLEPLESTSIYLIQAAIEQFIARFPLSGDYAEERDDYNRHMTREFERVRDFLVLHYHATKRDDSEFWRHMRSLEIPDSLAERIALFRETGQFNDYQQGLFLTPSWLAVFVGQGIIPARYDSRADSIETSVLKKRLLELRHRIADTANNMPGHEDYLQRFCDGKAA